MTNYPHIGVIHSAVDQYQLSALQDHPRFRTHHHLNRWFRSPVILISVTTLRSRHDIIRVVCSTSIEYTGLWNEQLFICLHASTTIVAALIDYHHHPERAGCYLSIIEQTPHHVLPIQHRIRVEDT